MINTLAIRNNSKFKDKKEIILFKFQKIHLLGSICIYMYIILLKL